MSAYITLKPSMVQTITDGETITLVIDLSSEDRKKLCGCELVNNRYGPRSLSKLPGSSKKVVLDPFGCSGTTYAVAEKMGRRWLGWASNLEIPDRSKAA